MVKFKNYLMILAVALGMTSTASFAFTDEFKAGNYGYIAGTCSYIGYQVDQTRFAPDMVNSPNLYNDKTRAEYLLKVISDGDATTQGFNNANGAMVNLIALCDSYKTGYDGVIGEGVLGNDRYSKDMFGFLAYKADQGETKYMVALSGIYDSQPELDPDKKRSFAWALKAASAGDTSGMLLAMSFYFVGDGVKKDLVLAGMWANILQMKSYDDQESIDLVLGKLTPVQKKKALDLARVWIASH